MNTPDIVEDTIEQNIEHPTFGNLDDLLKLYLLPEEAFEEVFSFGNSIGDGRHAFIVLTQRRVFVHEDAVHGDGSELTSCRAIPYSSILGTDLVREGSCPEWEGAPSDPRQAGDGRTVYLLMYQPHWAKNAGESKWSGFRFKQRSDALRFLNRVLEHVV
jgi:hypothetical protein